MILLTYQGFLCLTFTIWISDFISIWRNSFKKHFPLINHIKTENGLLLNLNFHTCKTCFTTTVSPKLIYIFKDVNSRSLISNSNFFCSFLYLSLRSASFSINFISSLFLACNLAYNSLFDKQRFLLIVGIVVEFRSLGAFLVDLVGVGDI